MFNLRSRSRRAALLAVALAVSPCRSISAAHDPHHPHDPHEHAVLAESAPEAPTLEHRIVLGNDLHRYQSVPGWCTLPDERPLGNTHGTIVIDNAGHVYFNTDTQRSIMVYQPDGSFMRSFADAMPGIHGMVLRTEDGEQFIYAAHLGGKQIVKMKLDGSVEWTLGVPIESGKYDDNPGAYNPTSIAVAPNGDLFVADGYGRNWVHQYSADRTYIRSIGGPGAEPGRFRTCHGLAIDTRGDEPVLLACDRENRRLQRFDLDGGFIDVPITDLRRPCSVSIWKDYLAVAELEGRVTILNADFEIEAHLGDNPDRNQWANNGVPTDVWQEGVFTAPHGCCFDAAGNLYVMDWNANGRVSKLVRLPLPATAQSQQAKRSVQNMAPCLSPDGSKIVFYSNRDGNHEIYVMDVDSASVKRLTHNTVRDYLPKWSPDGSKIVYFTGERDAYELCIMDMADLTLTRVSIGDCDHEDPSWSPDGSSIVFNADLDGDHEIYIKAHDDDETACIKLTDNDVRDYTPDFSPDGERIVFVSSDNDLSNSNIYVMNADGTGRTQLTETGVASTPVWSPDGEKILFMSKHSGNADLYVMNADGGELHQLTSHSASDLFPSWSADGRKIVFSRRDSDGFEIYTMDADGSDVIRLTHGRDGET